MNRRQLTGRSFCWFGTGSAAAIIDQLLHQFGQFPAPCLVVRQAGCWPRRDPRQGYKAARVEHHALSSSHLTPGQKLTSMDPDVSRANRDLIAKWRAGEPLRCDRETRAGRLKLSSP